MGNRARSGPYKANRYLDGCGDKPGKTGNKSEERAARRFPSPERSERY
jgi:hypothetical protein